VNDLLYEISGWFGYLTRPLVLLQCISSALLALAYLLWLRPRLSGRGRRLELAGGGLLWLALRLNVVVLNQLGRPYGLALYFTQLFGLWLILNLLPMLAARWIPAAPAERFLSRVVRPLFLLLVVGSTINQLDSLQDVSDIPLFPFFDGPMTTGGVLLVFVVPYFLVTVAEVPMAAFGRLLQSLLNLSDSSRVALELVGRYLFIGIGMLWLLRHIGIGGTALAAVAGGLSVGMGFALKELLSNFVTGLWLLVEGSVRPGEILFIDGDPCQVRRLGLRAALLWRERDNAELVIPNQDFFTKTTTTYTGSDRLRRCSVLVGAGYRHDPTEVMALLVSLASTVPGVLPDPAPRAFVLGYGDSAIQYSLRFWIADPMKNVSTCSAVNAALWQAFRERDIEIPYPQRVLHGPPAAGTAPHGDA
jgi:small-conductance mechanosensitive channel